LIGRFQALEYVLSFRVGRASLADCSVTSGIAIYRRDALARVLETHSLSVYGEDLENALILLGLSERIYYDGRLVIATDGPATWRRWFSQRTGWYHGLARAYTGCFAQVRRISRRGAFQAYQYLFYLGVLSLGLQFFRIACLSLLLLNLTVTLIDLFTHGWAPRPLTHNELQLLSVLGGQLILVLVAQLTLVPKAERPYTAPIVPVYVFYSMLHVLPTSLGLVNWLTVTLWGRRIYRDYFMREEDLPAGLFSRRRMKPAALPAKPS
jgi:cellulose synthase/poly-beta-1,6-N-acetylglucosamine synthase-like glycosyltransferase